jgi:trehalose synthase
MAAFASVAQDLDAHLILAGPSPASIADDPEGSQTFEELRRSWSGLRADVRRRVHIASLPMADIDENAAIVNALQWRSDVVIQNSLAEGFGLTVAEAMWKGTPTIASAVGGIQDQIDDGVSGILLRRPGEADELGRAITRILSDRPLASRLGRAGHKSVRDRYLAPYYLIRVLGLIEQVQRAL